MPHTLTDDDIVVTRLQTPVLPGARPYAAWDADGTDSDADGTDSDADGTDGADADGTDSGDADATDPKAK
jgi:hypothetical protein